MPAIMFAVWALMRFLPRIDPRRANYASFQGTYHAVIAVIVGFMGIVHVAVIGSALGWPISIPHVVLVLTGLLFVAIGKLLPRARANWFFGIRTPWTLSSDAVWERTHRLGGVLFMLGGVVLIAAAFGPATLLFPAFMFAVVLSAVIPVLYSLVLWMREKRDGNSQSSA
jgi:uncharacterized membrane protein